MAAAINAGSPKAGTERKGLYRTHSIGSEPIATPIIQLTTQGQTKSIQIS